MGLGPPVCEKCWVIGEFRHNDNPWYCPICGSTKLKASLWSCGVSQAELEGNLRFLKFMKGPDAVDNSVDTI
jgi:hypothetical protein